MANYRNMVLDTGGPLIAPPKPAPAPTSRPMGALQGFPTPTPAPKPKPVPKPAPAPTPAKSTTTKTTTTVKAPPPPVKLPPPPTPPTKPPATTTVKTTATADNTEEKPPLVLPDAQSDWYYQQELANLAKALQSFRSNKELELSQYNRQFADSVRSMGWDGDDLGWDQRDVTRSYGRAYQDNEGDFAGRGAYYSGLYGNAQNDMTTMFNDNLSQMNRAKDDYASSIQNAIASQEAQNRYAQDQALAAAAARVAAQYGVGVGEVPVGGKVPGGATKNPSYAIG